MKQKILFIGPFPPPMGGAAKNTKIIQKSIEDTGIEVVSIKSNYSKLCHSRTLLYHFGRLFQFFFNCLKLLHVLVFNKISKCYIVPDGGFGFAYSAIYIITIFVFRKRIIIHHRTFKYVNKYYKLIDVIFKFVKQRSTHVFLSKNMQTQFFCKYGTFDYMICGNSAFLEINQKSKLERTPNILNIGYLSNLCYDKGVDLVEELFKKIHAFQKDKSVKVNFLIAGSPVDKCGEISLANLKKDLGDSLNYFGFVSGESKQQFFEQCDIFVFPTRFEQEAQPNVIYESMASGAVCLSVDRGCISEMIDNTHGNVAKSVDDFVHESYRIVIELIFNKIELARMQRNSLTKINFLIGSDSAYYLELQKRIIS